MFKSSILFVSLSVLALSVVASAGQGKSGSCSLSNNCALNLDQVVAVKERYEPSFFAIPGIHAIGITLCSMEPVVVSLQEYCISIAAVDQFSFDSFVSEFPSLEADGIPIKLRIAEMAVAQPGVVVAD